MVESKKKIETRNILKCIDDTKTCYYAIIMYFVTPFRKLNGIKFQ